MCPPECLLWCIVYPPFFSPFLDHDHINCIHSSMLLFCPFPPHFPSKWSCMCISACLFWSHSLGLQLGLFWHSVPFATRSRLILEPSWVTFHGTTCWLMISLAVGLQFLGYIWQSSAHLHFNVFHFDQVQLSTMLSVQTSFLRFGVPPLLHFY